MHNFPTLFQVGLLNVDGYYNSLLSFIDKAVEEGFISPNARQIIVSAPTAKELVKKLEEYVPCHERVASKLSWEMEQLGYKTYDISREPHDRIKAKTGEGRRQPTKWAISKTVPLSVTHGSQAFVEGPESKLWAENSIHVLSSSSSC
ncbi:hypothetical protein GOBAR_AA27633 [Gossypium barbadense]|uniref:cytokinin riboside 5'-monophosphate phosphoribohydrolase n=1 Tax=Gossypium barbadense TaxID=3634 RepID=A0A2P5WPN6_GOSBA|nr:hypothetical protein GOBAR_AA27633 [Gossypium barbadense]